MDEHISLQEDILDNLNDKYLLFYIENSLYGVSLALVLEIIQVPIITRLPSVAYYVKGIVNLRGKVVPVIDVRTKFNLPEKPYDDKTCIVVLDIHDMHIGLIVDSVSEVVTVDNDQLTAPPNVGNASDRYLSSITQIGGTVMLNIDFDRFFQGDIDNLNVL